MSGAAALVYESLWMRQFALVFGNTTYSVTVTLAALATFCRRFPYASLWPVPASTGSQDGRPTPVGDILLLGSLRPLPLDSRRVKAAWSLPGIREDLSAVGIRDELDLLAAWTADREDLLAFAGQAPENTDERPLLELNAPRGLYSASNSREQRLCTGRWAR